MGLPYGAATLGIRKGLTLLRHVHLPLGVWHFRGLITEISQLGKTSQPIRDRHGLSFIVKSPPISQVIAAKSQWQQEWRQTVSIFTAVAAASDLELKLIVKADLNRPRLGSQAPVQPRA
ncbi:cohesin complex subunit [Aspergillus luchuensis]|uniref:Cohesin complex subunit n=1 Tax=Aspergillus kawachii TaxID=1069201 RepID=A0A146FDV9_ASPKA|nr:cohesin complex subunit [Aspergillus luchuensis]